MLDAEFLQNPKVILPAVVVFGVRKFILPDGLALPLNLRLAVLHAGSEHELGHKSTARKDVEASTMAI